MIVDGKIVHSLGAYRCVHSQMLSAPCSGCQREAALHDEIERLKEAWATDLHRDGVRIKELEATTTEMNKRLDLYQSTICGACRWTVEKKERG